jgi:hypothetical protein
MRETPFVVPRLEVQPITVPKLEFDITRQAPRVTPKPSIVETSITETKLPVTRFNDGVTELPKVDLKTIKDSADKEIQGWLNLSAENRRRVFTVKPTSEATVTKLGFTVEKVDEALREAGIKVIDEPLNYKVARLNASTDKASNTKAGAFLADNLVFVDELVNRTEAQIASDLAKRYNDVPKPSLSVSDAYGIIANSEKHPLNKSSVLTLLDSEGALSDQTVYNVSAALRESGVNNLSTVVYTELLGRATEAQRKIIIDIVHNGNTIPRTPKYEPDLTLYTPPASENTNMYHGAAREIHKLDDSYYDTSNVYGNGLYTTDNVDIANSYRKKNVVDDTYRGGYLYDVKPTRPQTLYDLDKRIDFTSEEGKVIENHLKRIIEADDPDFGEVASMILDGSSIKNSRYIRETASKGSLAEIMDFARSQLNQETFTEFVDSFRKPLEQFGYTGYTHEGGVLTNSGIRHKVNIYWKSEEALKLQQLEPIPVPTSKPVVVTDSAITTVADLQEAAKGIGTLGEVSQWSVRGDFITPLKEVLNAVDDLGLDVLNTLALSRMVKGGIGKLSNKTVEGVAASLQKVELKTAEDIAKSIFNALWRKSTPDQKEIILGKISTTRLEQLGLERVQTKIVPPTTPAPLQYVQAGVLDEVTVSAYHVVNDSQVPIEQLRVAMLREQGFDGRAASSMKEHPLSRSISEFGEVYDEDLIPFLKSRELSVSTPAEQKWSSKMLQQIWEVATPQQKAYIMKNVDSLEQLGLERIARSNVIDDHLPPEGVFDTPC